MRRLISVYADRSNMESILPQLVVGYFNFYAVSVHWRSQNSEKVTHIKGRQLNQAASLIIASLFEMGTFVKGNLLPVGANSFL